MFHDVFLMYQYNDLFLHNGVIYVIKNLQSLENVIKGVKHRSKIK